MFRKFLKWFSFYLDFLKCSELIYFLLWNFWIVLNWVIFCLATGAALASQTPLLKKSEHQSNHSIWVFWLFLILFLFYLDLLKVSYFISFLSGLVEIVLTDLFSILIVWHVLNWILFHFHVMNSSSLTSFLFGFVDIFEFISFLFCYWGILGTTPANQTHLLKQTQYIYNYSIGICWDCLTWCRFYLDFQKLS